MTVEVRLDGEPDNLEKLPLLVHIELLPGSVPVRVTVSGHEGEWWRDPETLERVAGAVAIVRAESGYVVCVDHGYGRWRCATCKEKENASRRSEDLEDGD